jgi:superfamily II DNA or RNA helicase
VNIVQTHFKPGPINGWHEFLDAINNAERNMLIIELIPKGKSTLILADRVAHAEDISAMLNSLKIDHVLAHGALPTQERDTLMKRITQSTLTIGTTGLLGEGLDVAHWDTLILASPISSETKLLQAIGRVVRPSKDKEVATIFDLHDDSGLSGSSLKKRLELYRKHNIQFDFNWDAQPAKCA